MVGSLCESNCENDEKIMKLKALAEFANLHSEYSITSNQVQLLPPLYEGTLTTHEIHKLQVIYEYIYPGIRFSHFYQGSKKCSLAGELISTSLITAFWPVEACNLTLDGKLQVGQVHRFIKHSMKFVESGHVVEKVHIFCVIEWYIKHRHEDYFGSSAIMCMPVTYCADACQFMPIQCIYSRCAHGKLN